MESASAHRARSRADRLVSFSRAHRARLEFLPAVRRPFLREAARALIPEAHAQKLETPDYIQVEQRVRVVHAAVATRPPRLLPAIKAANHHLRRMDQVVMQILNLTRSESRGPMRFFQLASETSFWLAVTAVRAKKQSSKWRDKREWSCRYRIGFRWAFRTASMLSTISSRCVRNSRSSSTFA